MSEDPPDALSILAKGEAATLDQLVEVTTQRDSWRGLAIQALAHAHELHRELDRVRTRYHELLEERRATREVAA